MNLATPMDLRSSLLAGFDGGFEVITLDELRENRKKIGMCPTCGGTRTHKPGIWKSLMPEVRTENRFDSCILWMAHPHLVSLKIY